MLQNYNNQTILTMDHAIPATDKHAVGWGNSLRLVDTQNKITEELTCKNKCLDLKECVNYKYDQNTLTCKLYRKEPFKTIPTLSLDDCINTCSHDNECDYISHDVNNTCSLHSREPYTGTTIMNDGQTFFNYPIYGYNIGNGASAATLDDCKKMFSTNDKIYYDDYKYCIPKDFTIKGVAGSTTVFFDKTPLDNYAAINGMIGLKSTNRQYIDAFRYVIVIVIIIVLIMVCWRVANIELL